MTFISTKSYQDLIADAEASISFFSIEEAMANLDSAQVQFIDLRVYRELDKTGVIPGALSCPRGLLEFWLDQDSPYARQVFAKDATFVFYCDNGWRSMLSTQMAQTMGLKDAFCLRGGLDAWLAAGNTVEPYNW